MSKEKGRSKSQVCGGEVRGQGAIGVKAISAGQPRRESQDGRSQHQAHPA